MSDNDTTTDEEQLSEQSDTTAAASESYKVRGKFADESGAGVLGINTAESGTPIGVEGAVSSADGYGLSTPHDARVSGTAELAALAGALTGNQEITDLLGDGLAVDAGALSAADARPNLDDGSTSVTNTDALTFGSGLRVVDNGDGTVTVRLDRNLKWFEAQKLEDDAIDTKLGRAAALDADGTTTLIGQPNKVGSSAEGRVLPAVEGERSWNQQSSFKGSENTGTDGFGRAVDLSADGTIGIVGGPEVYSLQGYVDILDGGSDWSSPGLLESYTPSDFIQLGYSVALSDDGTIAFVGAPMYPDTLEAKGAAFVYDSDGTWSGTTRTTTLTADSPTDGAHVGFSTAVDGDGTTAFLGAPYEPTEVSDSSPDPTAPGELYVYDGSGGWGSVSTETAIVTPDDSSDNDEFGSSVAVTTDGNLAFVGAPGDSSDTGAVYVFDGSSGWDSATQVTKLTASDGAGGDRFGTAVDVDRKGLTAIVGAPRDDSDAGAAYVFDGSSGWSGVSNESQKQTSKDVAGGDRFGRWVAVARDSSTAFLGAPDEKDSNSNPVGAAYAFYGTE